MAKKEFSDEQWAEVTATLNANPGRVGLPARRDDSLVLGSWNIRKFGDKNSHSENARRFYARFGASCDLLAIQEIMTDMFSLRDLRDRMQTAVPEADFRILCSDVTGRAPGARGLAERLGFIYNANRIQHTEVASDISFDRSEIINNVNESLMALKQAALEEDKDATTTEKALRLLKSLTDWRGLDKQKTEDFYDFIRSPHLATFKISGEGNQCYDITCVNAHLMYGKKKQREIEFLTLLEWVFLRSDADAEIMMILGDLNLDFESSNDDRLVAIKRYLKQVNEKRAGKVKVNFPFLEDHPTVGEIRTNAREKETFDHIAYFHNDGRLPLEQHNNLAGQSPDHFDYGVFNFVKLFRDAGLISAQTTKEEYSLFEHDVSDHMPVWARVPIPHAGQHRFF